MHVRLKTWDRAARQKGSKEICSRQMWVSSRVEYARWACLGSVGGSKATEGGGGGVKVLSRWDGVLSESCCMCCTLLVSPLLASPDSRVSKKRKKKKEKKKKRLVNLARTVSLVSWQKQANSLSLMTGSMLSGVYVTAR